ncbi:unnamed protein product [Parascedosporium putredinis]|uniref:Major facilitator superfamily (MFS) profile domain-containing protein n=1 Tax=Parascedosporium putredinis TaxID=1442378 RepID=A0A9P1H8X1_9PEZI|nr:unnamed protein product [Parascedosporium putredinis]CAI8000254.1 unnamed protein product [Parascedosporium putredinis]
MESVQKEEQTQVWSEHSTNDLALIADQEEHATGVLMTVRKNPTLVGWCFFSVFTCLLVSFENQAAGLVLSVPRFRQDFGYKFGDEYVLDAAWQSAFFGGPIASTIIGTLASGYFADRLGRKPLLIGAVALSFVAVAIEFIAETNAISVFVAQFAFSAASFIGSLFMPESPTWLLSVGQDDKAARSLKRLGYADADIPMKTAQIRKTLEQSRQETEGSTYLELFRGSNARRTVISIMPLSIQALGGVLYRLLRLTVILMLCAGLAVHGSAGSIKGSVALIIMYNFFYNISIGATAYTLLVEVATSRLRVKTIAVGVALQYIIYTIWAFVLPVLFNPDKANLGAKTAFIFGGLSIFCLAYLWFYQVETAGRSYDELDEMFMNDVSVKDFGTYITEAQRKEK